MKKSNTSNHKTGLWLIGAYGGIGTCVAAGLAGIARDLYSKCGLVSERDEFQPLNLMPLADIVLGGCDIRNTTFAREAASLQARAGILGEKNLDALKKDFATLDRDISCGVLLNSGPVVEKLASRPSHAKIKTALAQINQHIRAFQAKHSLADVIVVNLASAEAFSNAAAVPTRLADLRKAIDANKRSALSAGVLYAYAAIDAGFPYINFSPSISSEVPAIKELAEARRVPHMGKDGKTGETLLKTVLAPMFAARNLKVLSWIGHNILGNRDGEVLADSRNAKTKLQNKSQALQTILNDPGVDSQVRIDYVKSLDDWKTAWDFIHFKGFLDTKMIMQFIWQGSDSALAAPLVIDLARLIEHAHRNGLSGAQKQLACFFKAPTDTPEQSFAEQYRMLTDYAKRPGHVRSDRT
jgi:myo-inositol-1-phosphate synthase